MCYCYIVEAENGLAKVGYAFNPEYRFTAIRGHSPVKVRLIAKWRASFADEKDLHRKFDKQRSHSEWFRIEGEFETFLESLRGVGVSPERLEWDWTKKPIRNRLNPIDFFREARAS